MNEENMRAAIELHRPILFTKHGQRTTDPLEAGNRYGPRCDECAATVSSTGCRTWRIANGVDE